MILDEPSSALDEKTQDNIFNNLKIFKRKKDYNCYYTQQTHIKIL